MTVLPFERVRERRPTPEQRLWAAVGRHYVVTLMLLSGSLVAELHRRGTPPADALLRVAPYDPDRDRGRFLEPLGRDQHGGIPDASAVLALLHRVEADCAVSLRMRVARARSRPTGRSA
jgi:hypothetical protein